MVRIRTSRFPAVLIVAAFLNSFHAIELRAQDEARILIDASAERDISVRVSVGTPFKLEMLPRWQGQDQTFGCGGNGGVGLVTRLSGHVPGTLLTTETITRKEVGSLNLAFWTTSVLEGQPTLPGVYELRLLLAQNSGYSTCEDWVCPPQQTCTLDTVTGYWAWNCSCPALSSSNKLEIIVTEAQIDSLEVTQAIQENKSPGDLYGWLTQKPPDPLKTGDLPVPLIENKPVLLRVYLKEVQIPTVAKVRMWLRRESDDLVLTDDRLVNLVPGCTPRKQRLHLESSLSSCRSADFYADKSLLKADTFQLWVGLEDLTNQSTKFSSYCTDLFAPYCQGKGSQPQSNDTTSDGSGYLVGRNLTCKQWPNQGVDAPPGTIYLDSEFRADAVWGCLFPPISVDKADAIVLHPVSVCYDPTDVPGSCGDATEIGRMSAMLKQVAPTAHVTFGSSGAQLVIEPHAGETADHWWDRMSDQLEQKVNERADFRSVPGERHIIYGVVHPDAPSDPIGGQSPGGQAYLDGNSAASRSSVIRFAPANVETNVEVMAHETGHVFGLEHTGSSILHTKAPPGCYALADDVDNPAAPANKNYFFWPYVDPVNPDKLNLGNYLYSGDPANPKMEVGLDFARNRVRGTAGGEPNQSFEMMSYCSPRWVTPWSYRGMYKGLLGPTIVIPLSSGTFDEVSGTVTESGLVFDPVFTLETSGPTDQGSGSYRIEVRNSGGGVLSTRWFTPRVSTTESASGDVKGPPYFTELVPHQTGAASIAVMDDTGKQAGTLQLGGVAPTVKIAFPAGGEVLQGVQNISWSVTDPDSSSHVFRVQYSADNGTTWSSLTMSYQGLVLPINFDQLPGASGTALIRVYASDGVNTGQATSKPFSVPKKLPKAKISYPANGAIFHVGEFLNLEGIGFDADTGILSDSSLTWSSSSLGGTLGTGNELNFGYLGESAVGNQTIKLTATDSDGN